MKIFGISKHHEIKIILITSMTYRALDISPAVSFDRHILKLDFYFVHLGTNPSLPALYICNYPIEMQSTDLKPDNKLHIQQ